MSFYECVLIARQEISASQVEQLSETLSQIVRDNGGQVVKTESWGLKTLAYKIKKNRKGHYVMLGLDAPPAAVAELERQMSINEDILRYQTVRVEAMDPNTPSVMMQSRGDRPERGERGGRRFEDRGPRPPRRHEGGPSHHHSGPSEEASA